MRFFFTFPCIHIFSDNWVEVEAENEEQARLWADKNIEGWAFCYKENSFHREYFPKGRIGRVGP